MNEQTLAARLRNKDEQALEETIRRFTPLTAAIIYNVSKGTLTKEDIEEVISDVFLTLWKNTDNIIPEKLKGYICCIAKTKALNKLSSSKKGTLISLEEYAYQEDIEDDFSITDETEKKDINQELNRIIHQLDEPDQSILIRYYYYYQSTTRIAELMNLKLETVKTKLKRTRAKIKAKLIEGGYVL